MPLYTFTEVRPTNCPFAPPSDHGHPGILLGEQVLPALGLTVSQAASNLATTRQNLHRILSGQSAISADMALRLERFCGVPATFWLPRQQTHDLARVQLAMPNALARVAHHPLPHAVLIQIGAADAR